MTRTATEATFSFAGEWSGRAGWSRWKPEWESPGLVAFNTPGAIFSYVYQRAWTPILDLFSRWGYLSSENHLCCLHFLLWHQNFPFRLKVNAKGILDCYEKHSPQGSGVILNSKSLKEIFKNRPYPRFRPLSYSRYDSDV
ncbi:hypothetical protein HS088_TW09G01377 [Tripterygium wilfordii]|uniref:Uncharacterized protein n=1 Tax=Tripterygium wilfordii TaxID=458696 RepID=A0A7J7DAI9_TRIWF|nr:hypothetical protein HS088_TW09G01377 [Tripterygium wilfordii]